MVSGFSGGQTGRLFPKRSSCSWRVRYVRRGVLLVLREIGLPAKPRKLFTHRSDLRIEKQMSEFVDERGWIGVVGKEDRSRENDRSQQMRKTDS